MPNTHATHTPQTRHTHDPHHTILKVNFLSKNSILTNPNIFTSFSPNFFFLQFFSLTQRCQKLKSPKPKHFHEFFSPQKIDNFLGKSKLNFWTKNQDFEQCNFSDSIRKHTFPIKEKCLPKLPTIHRHSQRNIIS